MKTSILYWLPRILGILAILFMMMFSLDVFGSSDPLGKQLLGFFIHNIPAMVLIIILVAAWRREMTGGILLILFALIGCLRFRAFSGNPGSLIVMAPFFIAGCLFILHHVLVKKTSARTMRINQTEQ